MANPFKPEDKVRTKLKGSEVEATVRAIWNDEVQVRTPDGVLRWRTAKTVWLVVDETVLPSPESVSETTAPAVQPTSAPTEAPSVDGPHPEAVVASDPQLQTVEAQAEAMPSTVEPESTAVTPEPAAVVATVPLPDASAVTPCGVEPMVLPHRKKRRRK